MKITIAKSDLSRALDIAQRAVPTATMPIITCVLLQAEGKTLTIVATNLDMGLVLRCPADVTEPGTVAVPAKMLGQLVGSFVSDAVRIESSETFITLECGRNKTILQTQDADDFPPLPEVPAETDLAIDAGTLKTALGYVLHAVARDDTRVQGKRLIIDSIGSYVLHAVARDDTRPVLTGVYLRQKGDDNQMTLAAADGYQLAVANCTTNCLSARELAVIVPGRNLVELSRLLGNGEVDIAWLCAPQDPTNIQAVAFRGDNWELSSRLVAGKYPNYEQMIPERYTTRIEIDRGQLMAALRAVRVVADQAQNYVRFQAADGLLNLSARASDVGEASEAIEATITANGSDALGAFGLNGQMLSGILAALPGDRVTVDGTTPGSPFVCRPVSGDDCLMVQMPMHTGAKR